MAAQIATLCTLEARMEKYSSRQLQRVSVYYEDQPLAFGLIAKGTTVPLNGTVFTER